LHLGKVLVLKDGAVRRPAELDQRGYDLSVLQFLADGDATADDLLGAVERGLEQLLPHDFGAFEGEKYLLGSGATERGMDDVHDE